MSEQALVPELLHNIRWAIEQIQHRSKYVETYEDFLADDKGRERLDSICMQFINIGEALKKIDQLTSNELLQQYPDIDWRAAKGMRDVITHHYFDIDAEVVYRTIQHQLPKLLETVSKMIAYLEAKSHDSK
ncbi:MAG: DUF86 domain-containing protein [Candidatus Marinimicrobia bacterium]|nr:DUF86 domain-containing protein [Candidatus Neomarinimicrobiota bacterium]MCF7828765.1 DUF86 domain-containing protein [Candidatus Neomarinimicrobiota bacterium]MCF7880682.1 DUF86 domain-containing protein [Candidatus Neomarinimicrobiota bacterium]